MTNIDISLAGTSKPQRGTFAAIFMFLCIFAGPIGWGIMFGMHLSLKGEIKEWERHQSLAAAMGAGSPSVVPPVPQSKASQEGWC